MNIAQRLFSVVVMLLLLTPLRAAQEPDATVAINEVAYKVTERNTVYWQYSWKMAVKNLTQDPIVIVASIEFQDAEGFIIDQGTSRPIAIRMQDVAAVTGTTLVKTANAPKITQAIGKVRRVK